MSAASPGRLPAVLTHREASEALQAIGLPGGVAAAAGQPAEWRIDASDLTDFDSSALAVLLECRRQASAAGASLVVEAAPAKLTRLAQLYGVDELLLGKAETSSASGMPLESL